MIQFAEKIFVAAHKSMEGMAIERQLLRLGHPKSHIIHGPDEGLDWTSPDQVEQFLSLAEPDQIYLPAGYFLPSEDAGTLDSLLAKTAVLNIIGSSATVGVKKLLLLVGSEVYPSNRLPPYAESDLLAGPIRCPRAFDALLEIHAMKLCEEISGRSSSVGPLDYRCAVIGTTYGSGQNYSGSNPTLVPRVIRDLERAKAHDLEYVEIALREDTFLDLLYIDDMAEAAVYLMELPRSNLDTHQDKSHHHFNVAHGSPVNAQRLCQSIAYHLGYFGKLVYAKQNEDTWALPKNLDPHRLSQLGWSPMMDVEQGIEIVCTDFRLQQRKQLKQI